MADKLRLGSETRELKIGQSFTNPKSTAFHSIKYDFKPASVDINKIATVDVGSNHQVTVTVPHLDGAGVPQTVFKGSQRPYTKECVLILDRITGEITLEKLSSNIQVKKTRSESAKVPLPQERGGIQTGERSGTSSLSSIRSKTPPVVGQRTSHKTRVTSGSRRPDRPITHLVPKHSPLHASPSYPSPGHNHKSPKRDLHTSSYNDSSHNSNALASLPMLGIDDYTEPSTLPPLQNSQLSKDKSPTFNNVISIENGVGEITDTSSSSSDSDSDSDNDTTVMQRTMLKANGHSNGVPNVNSSPKVPAVPPAHILNEDLCLSESGTDSD